MRCVVFCGSTSFPWLVFFFESSAVRAYDSQAYRKMDVTREHISRIFELREILLSFQTDFNLCQWCCCLCYPGEYLRLGTLISFYWAQVLEACDCLKLLSIYFDFCVDATAVVCHQLGLLDADLRAVGVEALSRCSSNFASSSSSPPKPSMSVTKRRLVIVLPLRWQCLRDLLRRLSWSFQKYVEESGWE